MPRMLNKGLTRSMQSLSRTPKSGQRQNSLVFSLSNMAPPYWKAGSPWGDVVSLLRIFVQASHLYLDHMTGNALTARNNVAQGLGKITPTILLFQIAAAFSKANEISFQKASWLLSHLPDYKNFRLFQALRKWSYVSYPQSQSLQQANQHLQNSRHLGR